MVRTPKAGDLPEVELPVTPMLDMTFQLLAFFIFTYHPAREGEFTYSLPATASSRPLVLDPAPDPVPDTDPDEKVQLTIVLKVQRAGRDDGFLSAVLVQSSAGGETVLANLDDLGRYLAQRRATGALKPTDSIHLQGESKLKYAFVMKAMDVCTAAGFRRIGLAPPPDVGDTN